MQGHLGYDIEYAVRDKRSGKIIPAGMLPIHGTKGSPEALVNGGLEIDCCGVEITPKPALTENAFVYNMLNLLDEVKAKFPQCEFISKPSHYFDRRVLMRTAFAMTMGCEPDFNAWTGERNPRPNPPDGLRSYGGHIHIEGGTLETIKAFDIVLGVWSVMNDRDVERRKMYGRAGAFRHKMYRSGNPGVEYRVLSNFWCDKESSIREVYQLARYAQGINPETVNQIVNSSGGVDRLQNIINNSVIEDATEIFKLSMAA